jgi:hypothetical protein
MGWSKGIVNTRKGVNSIQYVCWIRETTRRGCDKGSITRRWPFTNIRDHYKDCGCRTRVRCYFGGDVWGHKHDICDEQTVLDEHDDIR